MDPSNPFGGHGCWRGGFPGGGEFPGGRFLTGGMGGRDDEIKELLEIIHSKDPRYLEQTMRRGPKNDLEAACIEVIEIMQDEGGGGFGGF